MINNQAITNKYQIFHVGATLRGCPGQTRRSAPTNFYYLFNNTYDIYEINDRNNLGGSLPPSVT